MTRIAIFDYGAGNIFSLKNALEKQGATVEVQTQVENLKGYDGIFLPGVGNFDPAIQSINRDSANFLDVGGGATTEKVTEAFKIMLSNTNLRAILVNIFGGIMRCDVIASGVVKAAREVKLTLPLVVRLEGTNADLGKRILTESGLEIISANSMDDAARNVVTAVSKGE